MKKTKQYSLFEDNSGPERTPQQPPGGKAVQSPDKVSAQPIAHTGPLSELAFDVESTGRDPLSASVVGISLCREKGRAYYVPIRHTSGPNVHKAPNILRPVLEDAAIPKIGHNLKYDILILRQEGIRVNGPLYDTMLASYLLNPNKPGHSLEDVGVEYLSHKKKPFTDVLGKRASFAEAPVDEATLYAAEDAELAMELKDILFDALKQEGLERLYFDLEMPLIYVLADMEEAGVKIDKEKIEDLSKELDREMEILQAGIYRIAGEVFNINSPKQLCKVLFDSLGLKPLRKTKTGYSTGVDVLEELAKVHELPREILNYRTLHKLKTTYADTLPKLIHERTGRIHTSFNQTVTSTGRLSSSDPNLQNIPVRGQWGTRIREGFIADKGNMLISADYSQIELRILAHISGDAGLIDAFRKGIDIHTKTAADLFGVSGEAVTADMRRVAKVVNFGIAYGMSPYGLSEALNISPKEAGAYIDQYFHKYSGVRDYIADTVKTAKALGHVSTMLGRKRPIPEINSSNANARLQAERLAINTPIQGTAADLIKTAMINTWRKLKEQRCESRMVLQIHDELLFETPEGELEKMKALIRQEMENALTLSVPLKVDIGWGKNWAEAH